MGWNFWMDLLMFCVIAVLLPEEQGVHMAGMPAHQIPPLPHQNFEPDCCATHPLEVPFSPFYVLGSGQCGMA